MASEWPRPGERGRMLFTIVALAAVGLSAETGKIAGRVLDKTTGGPLVGASVVLVGAGLGAATDNTGYYAVLAVPAGTYTLEASMIGFRTVTTTGARVEPDRTMRLDFRLEQSTIAMPNVVVRAEKPMVSKEMTSARFTAQAREINYLPVDYVENLVKFSTGIAQTESTLHVRGGRASEVDYLVDGVSVVDPLTGDMGINLARGVADEVIFMPGGFSAEYGRAMSGVVNLVTANPKRQPAADYRVRSEKPMPDWYDFGYTDQAATVHLPAGNLRTVFAGGVTTTGDWDPRLLQLPHKGRADLSLYGKAVYDIAGKIRMSLSGAAGETRLDRYRSDWRLLLDNYRSDSRAANLGIATATWMPSPRSYFQLTASRFRTDKTFGAREPGPLELTRGFSFLGDSGYEQPAKGIHNPWGCRWQRFLYFVTEGTCDEHRSTAAQDWAVKASANSQIGSAHQLSAGATGDFYDLQSDWVRWPAWHPLRDTYRYRPQALAAYVQDRVEFEGLYADLGLRYDIFQPEAVFFDSLGSVPGQGRRDTATAKSQVSPRIGASFRITDWLFARANFGYYFQVPQYSMLYDNTVRPVTFRTELGDTGQLIVGNPDLKPEKTQSYELGLQGQVAPGLLLTVNLWNKDVRDLVATVLVPAMPHAYATYVNEAYARLSGLELIAEARSAWADGKVSYTLSYARGTSSYANENYFEFLRQGDTAPAVEHALDFDQRNRAFLQFDVHPPANPTGARWLNLVLDRAELHVLGYLGNGFPYTPPGGKGDPATWNTFQGPVRSNVDAVVTKGLRFGRVQIDLVAEVLNVLDTRDILYVYPSTGSPIDDGLYVDYTDPLFNQRPDTVGSWFGSRDYDPRRDHNHDGFVTNYEEYRSTYFYHKAVIDWVNNYGPPRRARLGFTVAF